jgi:hypothetical protein
VRPRLIAEHLVLSPYCSWASLRRYAMNNQGLEADKNVQT